MNFFVRMKRAMINFDEYQNFSMEKLRVGIKYFIKLILIFAIMLTIALTYKTYIIVNNSVRAFEESFLEFRIENDELTLEDGKDSYVLEDEMGYFAIIVDSQKTEVQDIDYDTAIIMLKDKIIIKNTVLDTVGREASITYEELSGIYDTNSITKQDVINYIEEANWIGVYTVFFIMGLGYNLVAHSILILIDVLLLSILGFAVSRIFKINFRYKPVLNMSFHAITLPVILSLIYFSINLLTGFEIKYFRMAYDAISYIYIVTAILIIKSDLIKQQMELMKIVEVQKQVKEEMDREEEKRQEEKKEKKDKEKDVGDDEPVVTDKKEKKKRALKPKPDPEGSQAFKNVRM